MTSQCTTADGNGVLASAPAPTHTTTVCMDLFEPFKFHTDDDLKLMCKTIDDLHNYVQNQLNLLNGRCECLRRYKASPRSYSQLNLDNPDYIKNLDDSFTYLHGLHERYNIPYYPASLTTDLACSPNAPTYSYC